MRLPVLKSLGNDSSANQHAVEASSILLRFKKKPKQDRSVIARGAAVLYSSQIAFLKIPHSSKHQIKMDTIDDASFKSQINSLTSSRDLMTNKCDLYEKQEKHKMMLEATGGQ